MRIDDGLSEEPALPGDEESVVPPNAKPTADSSLTEQSQGEMVAACFRTPRA